MRVIKVIESKVWRHKTSGRTVSIYGACPWNTDAERSQWELHKRGYTWACDDGTVGLCRQPVKTEEEAVRVMRKFNGEENE